MKPGQKVTPEVAGPLIVDWMPCPCGGEMKLHAKSIFHTLPYCDHFLNDEPTDYIRWVRINVAN